jgi:WD40 repeat protein
MFKILAAGIIVGHISYVITSIIWSKKSPCKISKNMSLVLPKNKVDDIHFGRVKVLAGQDANEEANGDEYIKAVCVYGNLIISGSNYETIKIWDRDSGRCIRELAGHTDSVNNLVVKDNLLISCSDDDTIRIWDMNTWACIKTLEGHDSCVDSICIRDNKIISYSDDETIKIWDIDSGKCIKTL